MKKYNVIWFDDEFASLEDIKEKAILNGINLIGFNNAKDGIEELARNIKQYDAAVVDGRFFKNPNQSGDVLNDKALVDVALALERFGDYKKLPWFILSGHVSFTKDINSFADAFKDNKVYDKLNDDDLTALWNDLKTEADQQLETQIRHKYQQAFDACTGKYLGTETAKSLLYLIKCVEDPNDNINTEEKLNAIRKIIEKLFTAFTRIGVLPMEVLKAIGGINNSSKFLAGIHPSYNYSAEILHPTIAFLLKNILQITQDGSHAKGDLNIKADQFIKNHPTGYLFNSVIFQLLEVLVWFKAYLDTNQDFEMNKRIAILKPTESSINFEGVIEQDSNRNYHCGEYLLNYKLVSDNYKVGDRIKIFEASENTQLRTRGSYPKFATRFIKI